MQSKDKPRPQANAPDTQAEGGEFSTFLLEDAEDNKILKVSLWAAIGLHAVLLLINFPNFVQDPVAEEPPEKAVFMVQPIKYQPPKVEKQRIPPKQVKRVPIPDPTPDAPEPIRLDAPEPEIDLPDIDEDFLPIPDAPPAPPAPPGPILVTGEVRKPEKIHAPQPNYTEVARRARIQGSVIAEAIVDRNGDVVSVKILKGLPMGLSEETLKVMKQWKFHPATLRGKPVDVYFNLTVHFKLQ